MIQISSRQRAERVHSYRQGENRCTTSDVIEGGTDRRTKLGKLIAHMSESWSTLFREGTDLADLTNLLRETFRAGLEVDPFSVSGVACRTFVQEQVLAGNPVVLGINWGKTEGHWVLVIGLNLTVDETGREICRFLVLDPGFPPLSASPWNGIIDACSSGGRYPYTWWTDGHGGKTKVVFDSAMALVATTGRKS